LSARGFNSALNFTGRPQNKNREIIFHNGSKNTRFFIADAFCKIQFLNILLHKLHFSNLKEDLISQYEMQRRTLNEISVKSRGLCSVGVSPELPFPASFWPLSHKSCARPYLLVANFG
jgi:hypothetical protein